MSCDYPNQPDANLVAMVLQGDELAWLALARRYTPLVKSIAISFGVFALSDEVVDIVFDTALRKLHQLKKPSGFKGWIRRIAKTRTSNFKRDQKLDRHVGLDALMKASEPSACPEKCASIKEELAIVSAALKDLPQVELQVLYLSAVEQKKGKEIAALLDISEAKVSKKLKSARKRIKKALISSSERDWEFSGLNEAAKALTLVELVLK